MSASSALRTSSTVELFYDVVSPYSFIAFHQLRQYAPLWRFTLLLRPVFQGAVMKASSNTPPGAVAAKAHYMAAVDLPRLSRYYQLPIRVPSNHAHLMYHTLGPMRVLTAVGLHLPDKVHPPHSAVANALSTAIASHSLNVRSPV